MSKIIIGPAIRKGAGGGDDNEGEEQAEEAVHSLPITSLQKAREQFPKIILACDLQQYLVKYVKQNCLLCVYVFVYTAQRCAVYVCVCVYLYVCACAR